ncbi:Protein CASC3 [Taenia solium]|eukprot:TsM_001163200 transcript=TsM_001163200 gene=TsM_001163200
MATQVTETDDLLSRVKSRLMTERHRTEKLVDDQKNPPDASSSAASSSNDSPPAPAEAQKSGISSEMQASGGQVAEQMTRCEETGETSFCDGQTDSKNPGKVDAEVAGNSTTPLPSVTSQRHEKSVLNETGETTFSEDDGEGEVNQVDTESSDDEDLAMRLRRRGGSDSEEEDEYEDEDEDEDGVEAEDEDVDEDECENEEDYYTDDRDSRTASEEEVLDSTKEADDTMTTSEGLKEEEKEGKEKKKHPGSPVNRRDPTYVPREGAFYFHDARDESADGDSEMKAASASGKAPTRRSGMLATRWEHDLYIEREQRPRTTEEIVSRYGYDIRKYGLDPTQEVTSRRAVGSTRKRGQARGRGVRFANSHNDVAAFTTKDFPTLEERENHRNRNQRGDSRFQGAKREENLRQCSEAEDHVATPHADVGSQEGAQKKIQPIPRQGRGARGFIPQAGHREVVVEEVRYRRGGRGRGFGRRFYGAEGDARRGFHNSSSTRNRSRVAPTVVAAPNSQPSLQQPRSQLPLQPPRSGKRYSVNRKAHCPDPPQEVQRVQSMMPTLPDAETRKLYRSVDPSIVAAFVQRHQMENPEAFEAAKAASLSMVEERTLLVVDRTPSPQQKGCEQHDPIGPDGDKATAKGNA